MNYEQQPLYQPEPQRPQANVYVQPQFAGQQPQTFNNPTYPQPNVYNPPAQPTYQQQAYNMPQQQSQTYNMPQTDQPQQQTNAFNYFNSFNQQIGMQLGSQALQQGEQMVKQNVRLFDQIRIVSDYSIDHQVHQLAAIEILLQCQQLLRAVQAITDHIPVQK
jgi:hypothetical protein